MLWRLISCQSLSWLRFLSHSLCYLLLLLLLLMVSFAVQELFSLIRSHLFTFVFIFITLGAGSKKKLLQFMSERILPMFFTKSFIVSSLPFLHLGL